jgi:hypothetical protein
MGLKVSVALFANPYLARPTPAGPVSVRPNVGISYSSPFLATGTNQHHFGCINIVFDLYPPTLRLLATCRNWALVLDGDIDAFDNDLVSLGIDASDRSPHPRVFTPDDLDGITLLDLHKTFSFISPDPLHTSERKGL